MWFTSRRPILVPWLWPIRHAIVNLLEFIFRSRPLYIQVFTSSTDRMTSHHVSTNPYHSKKHFNNNDTDFEIARGNWNTLSSTPILKCIKPNSLTWQHKRKVNYTTSTVVARSADRSVEVPRSAVRARLSNIRYTISLSCVSNCPSLISVPHVISH